MAFPVNRIANHLFLSLDGQVRPPRQETETETRLGVDGITVAQVGFRGPPFQLVSRVDHYTRESAWREYLNYLNLVGQNPVPLIKNSHATMTDRYLIFVRDVECLECSALLSSTIGYHWPSLGWLVCRWDLQAVAIAQQGT